MQFVNNLAVLHAREGYVDGPGRQYVSSPPLTVLLLLPYPSLPCRWETRTETAARRNQASPRPSVAARPEARAWGDAGGGARALGPRVAMTFARSGPVFPLEPVVRSEGAQGREGRRQESRIEMRAGTMEVLVKPVLVVYKASFYFYTTLFDYFSYFLFYLFCLTFFTLATVLLVYTTSGLPPASSSIPLRLLKWRKIRLLPHRQRPLMMMYDNLCKIGFH